jgi:phosphoribosylformylglycinamidine cyclo-ligase
LTEFEAHRSLNMGIGMIVVVGPTEVDKTLEELKKNGATPSVIGQVIAGQKGVEFV